MILVLSELLPREKLSEFCQKSHQTTVVEKELSRGAKLSIYLSIHVPTLTCGHELWVATERMRLQVQAAEMSFLCGGG